MRCTCVSAGTMGASKQKHMTQAAVFGPTPAARSGRPSPRPAAPRRATPGRPRAARRRSGRGSPGCGAPSGWRGRPPGSSASTLRRGRGAHVVPGRVPRRGGRRRPRYWLASVVLWLSIVVTSSVDRRVMAARTDAARRPRLQAAHDLERVGAGAGAGGGHPVRVVRRRRRASATASDRRMAPTWSTRALVASRAPSCREPRRPRPCRPSPSGGPRRRRSPSAGHRARRSRFRRRPGPDRPRRWAHRSSGPPGRGRPASKVPTLVRRPRPVAAPSRRRERPDVDVQPQVRQVVVVRPRRPGREVAFNPVDALRRRPRRGSSALTRAWSRAVVDEIDRL